MKDKEKEAIEKFAEKVSEAFDIPKPAVMDEAKKWWGRTRKAFLDKYYGKKLEFLDKYGKKLEEV